MEKFFIGCALGQEQELLNELEEIFPFLISRSGKAARYSLVFQDYGGVEIETELELGLQLNFFLKTANRILLRLVEGPCQNFKDLENHLKKWPLAKFQIADFQLNISASKSKLNNEKRILMEFERLFPKLLNPESLTTLYVRMFENLLSVSLDLSGDLLHKRTLVEKKDAAPLRESLAFLGLRALKGPSLFWTELSHITLVDPMAGSGTLLKEGCLALSCQIDRRFAFEEIPILEKTTASIRKKLESRKPTPIFKKVIGFDRDQETFEKLSKNVNSLLPIFDVEIHNADFRKAAGKNSVKGTEAAPVWVISNPPYGKRIPRDFKIQDLIQNFLEIFNPDRLGLFLPKSDEVNLQKTIWRGYKSKIAFHVQHGGLPIQFVIFHKLNG